MKREQTADNAGGGGIPFEQNLIFYVPLDENGFLDRVSGVNPTYGAGGIVWDSIHSAYNLYTTSNYQQCLNYYIPDGIGFKSSENYNFTIYAKIYIKTYSGTVDYAILWDGVNWPNSDNSYSIGETHRFNTSTDNPITKNAWHDICLSKDTSNAYFYVDKTLSRTVQASQYPSFNISDAVAANKHKNISIGTSIYGYIFNVYLKDLRIYDRMLTASEVSQL